MASGAWAAGPGSDDDDSLAALERSIALGCTFFDTALAYGDGKSEQLLGQVLRPPSRQDAHRRDQGPAKEPEMAGSASDPIDEVFPADYIRQSTETSLRNLGVSSIDVQQFHVWDDSWTDDERWQRAVDDLKREGLIRAFGISLNRWEPANVLRALRTGLVDSVQVVYNVFDQNPEDELFPLCRELGVAVIARVPFDEGSLTGTLTRDMPWPAGDWRNSTSRRRISARRSTASTPSPRTSLPACRCLSWRSGSSSPTPTSRPSSPACASPVTWRPTWRPRTAARSRPTRWRAYGGTAGSGPT